MFDLPNLIQTVGYLGLFLIVYVESGILIGLFLPGDSLLFTAGFLASQGYLNIFLLLPLFFVAAFLGDSTGYFIGKKFGPRIFSRPKSFWLKPENVIKTANFFEKHGKKAIVLARFVPIVRTFIPVMAGIGKMKYEVFVFYNLMGAILWGVGLTLLGYLFGSVIPDADKYILPIVGLIVFASLLPGAFEFWRERRRKTKI